MELRFISDRGPSNLLLQGRSARRHGHGHAWTSVRIPEISLEWVDERFQWNPGEYGAIESIRVQGKDIWFPSIKDMLILT